MKKYTQIISLSLLFLYSILFTPPAFAKESMTATELLNMISNAKEKQVVLVNFYASWCPPCREEIPHLIQLRKKFASDKVLIIGINLDKSQEIMNAFDKEYKINYPTFHDMGSIQSTYRINAVPFTLVYSKSGKPIYAQAGFADEETLEEAITYGLN